MEIWSEAERPARKQKCALRRSHGPAANHPCSAADRDDSTTNPRRTSHEPFNREPDTNQPLTNLALEHEPATTRKLEATHKRTRVPASSQPRTRCTPATRQRRAKREPAASRSEPGSTCEPHEPAAKLQQIKFGEKRQPCASSTPQRRSRNKPGKRIEEEPATNYRQPDTIYASTNLIQLHIAWESGVAEESKEV